MIIKALLFDIGGVLYCNLKGGPRRKWERHLGLSQGQLAEIVFTQPLARRVSIGQATPDEVWQAVGKSFCLSTNDLATLRVDFWNGGEWDTELLDFIRSIKPRIKTETISDAWLDARQNVNKYVNSELFDVIVFSGEEGVMKPDPEIYQRALSRLGVNPRVAALSMTGCPISLARGSLGCRQLSMQQLLLQSKKFCGSLKHNLEHFELLDSVTCLDIH